MLLGTIAGLSPGPTMALLVSETVRHGFSAGLRVAAVPLVTDIPAAVTAMLLAREIQQSPLLLGLISIIGGCFLLWLAYDNARVTKDDFLKTQKSSSASLRKAATVNVLNPNFYIYWFSIPIPIFAAGTFAQGSLFAGGVICCSALTMVVMITGISKARMHFLDHAHVVLRILGIVLVFFAGKLLLGGLQYLTTY